MANTKPKLKAAERAFWQAEYLSISNQAPKFLDIYVKAIVIYFSVMGVLLGFALDNGSPELKIVLCLFALICCFLFQSSIDLAEEIIETAQKKRTDALTKLEQLIPGETEDIFEAGPFIHKICRTFTDFAIIGWLGIILYVGLQAIIPDSLSFCWNVLSFCWNVLFVLGMGVLTYRAWEKIDSMQKSERKRRKKKREKHEKISNRN